METRRRHPLHIGLKVAQDAPIDTLKRVWQLADEAGFDHVWAFDHFAGTTPDGSPALLYDGWSLLAAMGALTRRVRLGLLVSGMVYRHPAVLAKAAVTVDHLSGGRLEFGIGTGYAEVEDEMYGFEIDHLVGRLSEGLEVLKLLWTRELADFEGRYYRLHAAVSHPKPLQMPHPPIWIGAGGDQTLRLVARHANAWNPSRHGFENAIPLAEQLVAACEKVGRDPAEIRWCEQIRFDGRDPEAVIDELHRWYDAGFSELVLYCGGADALRASQVAAERVLPAFSRS